MMMLRFLNAFLLVLVPLTTLLARPEPKDNSKADADGPYVFYRGHQVLVKWLERRDSNVVVRLQRYDRPEDVKLRCVVSETKDTFQFGLHAIHTAEPSEYEMPDKMLVLSDIEGNFKALKTMLIGANIINEKFEWTFGKGSLVLIGDFCDRGLNVTECFWLLYKLEAEAEAAGGKLHFILGNHEILNLQGNSQYVRRKYIENARIMGEEFTKFYDANSEIGRWLRTKNAFEKIGNYGFCHGGLSPEMAASKLTISEINDISRQHIGMTLDRFKSEEAKLVYNLSTGVFWYRSMAKNMLERTQVNDILNQYGIRRLVIGHTLQPDITALYAGRVICIDLFHEENMRQGVMKTLWIENGLCYGLDSKGEKSSVFSIISERKKADNKDDE